MPRGAWEDRFSAEPTTAAGTAAREIRRRRAAGLPPPERTWEVQPSRPRKVGRPRRDDGLKWTPPWEPGMWDPLERNPCDQWWESPGHQAAFVNALRAVLGLDPIPSSRP